MREVTAETFTASELESFFADCPQKCAVISFSIKGPDLCSLKCELLVGNPFD